jgi:hypothetical protein
VTPLTRTLVTAAVWANVVALIVMVSGFAFVLVFDEPTPGMSLTLLDTWTVCRIDTPLGGGSRFILGLFALGLPLVVLRQLARSWRKRPRQVAPLRLGIRRRTAVLTLLVTIASSVGMIWSDFFLLIPFIERLTAQALSTEMSASIMRDNLWWVAIAVFAVSMASALVFPQFSSEWFLRGET